MRKQLPPLGQLELVVVMVQLSSRLQRRQVVQE
jgi:hypothetical protein